VRLPALPLRTGGPILVRMKSVVLALILALGLAAPAQAGFKPKVIKAHQGTMKAEFDFKVDTSLNNFWRGGHLRVWQGRKLIVNHVYGLSFSGGSSLPKVHIRDLDGSAPPEVIIDAFSGGAHCCGMSEIYTGKHRTHADWGEFGVPKLSDVDGDGKPEWHGLDGAFAYAFGSFAGSAFPVKDYSYAGNAVHDVTASYPAEVQADMNRWLGEYQKAVADKSGSEYVRSSLAAYAADAYTLGQGEAAMATVQAAIAAGQTQGGSDDTDPAYGGDYLADLQKLLRDTGYIK
jgi:hypothetical protein